MRHGHTRLGLVKGLAASGSMGLIALMLMGQAAGPALMASGKITSIDPQQKLLRLKTGLFTTREFVIEADTKITAGLKPISLEQLQLGVKAEVEYVQEGDKRVAQSINVESAEGGWMESPAPERVQSPAPAAPQQMEAPAPGVPEPAASPADPESLKSPGSQGTGQHPDIRY